MRSTLGPTCGDRSIGRVFGRVAQRERNCFASRRLWVRFPPCPPFDVPCWWNGRHSALRTRRLRVWGFKSLAGYQYLRKQTFLGGVPSSGTPGTDRAAMKSGFAARWSNGMMCVSKTLRWWFESIMGRQYLTADAVGKRTRCLRVETGSTPVAVARLNVNAKSHAGRFSPGAYRVRVPARSPVSSRGREARRAVATRATPVQVRPRCRRGSSVARARGS